MRREDEGPGGEYRPGIEGEDDEATRLDREHHERLRRARQARVAKLLVALFLVIVFIVFIIGNSEQTEVDFVFVEGEVSLIWVMVASAVLGGIVGFVLGRPGRQLRFHRRDDRGGEEERRR